MRAKPLSWVVALDGGTTTTRARLVHDGHVVATARRSVGVRDTVLSSSSARLLPAAVREAIREVLASAGGIRPDAVVAAGMLSSEIGLEVVPHVMAPAGPDELARGAAVRELPEVAAWPILFVPGVRTPASEGVDGWADADVMRGEECETLGALLVRSMRGPAAFVWPGSHTKLVEVDAEGRIARSHTTLAGEMTAALARHTLIAASLPEYLPEKPDPDAVAAGARLAQRDGLGRAAFLVRVAALEGAMPSEQRAAFWVGAVIADDAMRLARHTILRRQVPVLVGGREPQRALYAAMLEERLARPVTPLDDEEAENASAIGALEVARRREERRVPRRNVLNPD